MKTFLIIFLITPITLSQWELGGSYKIKSDIPENGFGISISRNLPFQGPNLGIKVRAEVNLLRENAEVNFSGINEELKFLSEDYNLHIIGEYFFNNFYPYFGFGFGYGELNSGRQNWQGFVLSVLIGSKFPVSKLINPYIEIQGYHYIADFDRRIWGRGMSIYQLWGVVGIIIPINTL